MALLETMSEVESKCDDSDSFCKLMHELNAFTKKADTSLNAIINSESNWLTRSMMHALR